MRKLVVLSVILVFVLAFSGIAGAGSWPGGDLPANDDTEVIPVDAKVYEYVEFRGDVDDLTFDTLDLIEFRGNEGAPDQSQNPTGVSGAWRKKDLTFYIASNFEVDFNMDLTQALTNGSDVLDTRLRLFDQEYIDAHGWDGAHMGATTSNRTFSGIQGCELHQYKLRVEATLGDVHEQPADDYSGTVTLTVGASGTV